jgi:transposase
VAPMYLKISRNSKTGKTYLSIAHGYWDKDRGHTRTKIIEKIGFLEDLQKKYDDPIAHFQKVVEEMKEKAKAEEAEYSITAAKNKKLEKNASKLMNYGYAVIMKLFYELALDQFLTNRQRGTGIECNTASIMKLLVISRILSPGSKKKAFEERGRYFDFERKGAFELVDVYRSLSHFSKLAEDIQMLIHDRISKRYGRNMEVTYYDVTNYYFEIDKEDCLRKKGYGKDGKKSPLVQMGLSMDADGLPISYEVFPGNESEKLHLRPMVKKLVTEYNAGKVIVVADSAQNTGNNVYYLDKGRQRYVFSQSIRGGGADFKKYVVDEKGYEWLGEEYKRKSRCVRREIAVDFVSKSDPNETVKKKKMVDQRQIVFYSEKYAARAREERGRTLLKARGIVQNPGAYTRATSYGALKYIKDIEFDKETGEVVVSQKEPYIDWEAVAEEEKYDGYYCIVTNVFDEGKDRGKFGDDKIIEIYRGLWRIEDSFRVTKSDLKTRPVYLSRDDRIKAHFLTCYISLAIMRLIQKKVKDRTGASYSPSELSDAMNNISCINESENLFQFYYRSDVTDHLGEAFGIDFTNERLTRAEIKKTLGSVKNQKISQ